MNRKPYKYPYCHSLKNVFERIEEVIAMYNRASFCISEDGFDQVVLMKDDYEELLKDALERITK